jgi:hypothetical protein
MALTPPSKHTYWIEKEDPTICCLQETHLTNGKTLPYVEMVEDNLPS